MIKGDEILVILQRKEFKKFVVYTFTTVYRYVFLLSQEYLKEN